MTINDFYIFQIRYDFQSNDKCVVMQIFANNSTVSNKITQDGIRQILHTALSGGSAEHSELLTVLRTIVKVITNTVDLNY